MVSLQEYEQKLNTAEKVLNEGRKNNSISLKQADNLLNEVWELSKHFTKENISLEMKEITVWILIEFIYINNNFAKQWKEENSHPSEEEYELIKKYSGKLRKWNSEFKKEVPTVLTDQLFAKLEVEIKEIEDFVSQEESYRKSPNGKNPNNHNGENGSNDNEPNDNGKGGGNRPSPSDNSQIDQQIKDLQARIKELEKNQPQNSNSNDKQKNKRELSETERELERLRIEKEKNRQQPGKQNPQGNQKQDNFPTGLVVGGGITIAILLMAVIFFWQRSKRKQ